MDHLKTSFPILIRSVGIALLIPFTVGCGLFGGGNRPIANPGPPADPAANQQTPFSGRETTNQAFADGIAATVNGRVITRSEVADAVAQQAFHILRTVPASAEREKQLREIQEKGLDALIEREIMLAEFDKRGFPIKDQQIDAAVNQYVREVFDGDRDKFVEELRRYRTTLRKFREEQAKGIKVTMLQQAIVRDKTSPPSPDEVKKFYQENSKNYRDEGEIKVRTITIPKNPGSDFSATPESQLRLAQDILKRLRNGANFGEMARTYSQDSAAQNGGDRGIINREGPLNAQLTGLAFSLKENEISDLIEAPSSYIILWAEARRYGRTPPLEEVREDIERRLTQQKRKALVDEWVAGVRSRASIKKY